MEKRTEDEPFSNIPKRSKRQKLNIGKEINQKRTNIIPDAFGLEDFFYKHELINLSIHELADELSNQKLRNQPLLFGGKIGLGGKIVETLMPFKGIEPFENCLESIDEHYDEGSIIVQDAVTVIGTVQIFLFIQRYKK